MCKFYFIIGIFFVNNLCYGHTPTTIYIQSSRNFIYSLTMMWSSAYCLDVTGHQILAALYPFENFCKFVSG